MKTLTLKRVAFRSDGTFGVLLDGNIPFALTCEREWRDNETQASCIPPGMYHCKRVNSPKFGDTFEVTGVPGRSAILFHAGNTEDDTRGCILVGEQFGGLNGKLAVLSSKAGFGEFLRRLGSWDEFSFEIMGV